MISRDRVSMARSLAECFRPRPMLSGVEYADRYGHVTGNAASKGKWTTRPYQRDWFYGFTSPYVEVEVCMKSARVGWSECVKIGAVQYYSHWKPSKIMIVQPVQNDAEEYSKEDISDLFRDSPSLQGLLAESKARGTATNTILLKKLTNGGLIDIVSAASGKGFRRKERTVVIFEEPSAYDAIDEGDQIKLGMNRSATTWNRKTIIGGTPIYPDDKTHQWFKKGDQQYRYLPCPHCGEYQALRWEQMRKEGEDAGKYECENCHELIGYASLRWMDEHGGWACPLGLDRSQQILKDGYPRVRSRHIWAAYSYHAGAEWGNLVSEYQEALEMMRKGDTDSMQTFHNTVLGVPWEDTITGKLNVEGLSQRRQDVNAGNGYPADVVPNGVLVLTAGVDVQGGGGAMAERLVVTIWGWGRGEEGWHVGHFEIDGDPQQVETLNQLDAVLETKWKREDGAELQIALGGIDDGGYATHEVRDWCRTRVGRWVPMKGSESKGKPLIGKGVPVNINRKNQSVIKKGVLMYPVGYETSIQHLQGRLRQEKPGPGYLHFGEAATDQFLAELFPWKKMPKKGAGKREYKWDKPTGSRDEAGDCTRMAYAALQLVARRYSRATMWDQLERLIEAQRLASVGLGEQTPRRRRSFRVI